jgi:hypothetical protein
MLSEIYGLVHQGSTPPANSRQAVERSSLKNVADPGVRRLLNRVKQVVAFDGHIKAWADGLSFADAFSHPHVQLRNVERKPRRDRGWNPAIALPYRETRQRFARLCTAHVHWPMAREKQMVAELKRRKL